ncbi:MAG: hypothetical protein CMP63_02445 [Flavobacteriales bacterium]|nr:hypothetical protein [Flavobacteriales bacterium]
MQKYKKHTGPLYAVAYSKQHDLLFTGGSDKVVATWDLDRGENTPLSIKTDSAVLNFQLLNNEKHLFIGLFNGDFHIIDIDTRKEISFFKRHKLGVFSSCYLSDRNMLFVGAGDGTLSIWDTKSFQLLASHQLGKGKIRAIQSVGNDVFIANSQGQIFTINLFAIEEYSLFTTINHPIFCLSSFSSNNSLLIGDKNAHLTEIEIESKQVLKSIPAHNWPIYRIEWLNSKEFVTCSRDKILKIWDATSMKVKQRLSFPEFQGHINSVNNLVSISSTQSIVSVGDDKQICLWRKS